MRVLSLFDGISCGRVALERAGLSVNAYYASEVDKYAIAVAQANHPDTLQIGDVRVVRQMCQAGVFGKIDMLIGGSPCQNLSFAGKQKGLSTKEGMEITSLEQYKQLALEGFEFEGQSYLFWEYVWIRELLQPTWWLLENVRMNKKWLKIFNDIMGVNGVLINSALVSAQNRQRFYWCNWPVSQPADRGIYLRDIIENGTVDREKSYCIDANYYKGGSLKNYMEKSRRQIVLSPDKLGNLNPSGRGMNGAVYGIDGKSPTLTTNKGEGSKIALRQSEARLMVRELQGVAVTPNGLRPFKNDGRKGSFSEIGTIATPDHKAQCLTSAHSPKITMKQLPRGFNKGFEKEVEKSPSMTSNSWEHNNLIAVSNKPVQLNPDKSCGGSQPHIPDLGYAVDGKSTALTASFAGRTNVEMKEKSNTNRVGGHCSPPDSKQCWDNIYDSKITYRKLTPVECERLQGLPDGYSAYVSNSQRYKMLGNGWQVDTVVHVFEELKVWAGLLGIKL